MGPPGIPGSKGDKGDIGSPGREGKIGLTGPSGAVGTPVSFINDENHHYSIPSVYIYLPAATIFYIKAVVDSS